MEQTATRYQVTFDRIGRTRDLAPVTVTATDGDDLADRLYRHALRYLGSRDVLVEVTSPAGDPTPREALVYVGGRPAGTGRVAVLPAVTYDREALVDVLVHHMPTATAGCHCGWGLLGASFPGHVADVYEATVAARADGPGQ